MYKPNTLHEWNRMWVKAGMLFLTIIMPFQLCQLLQKCLMFLFRTWETSGYLSNEILEGKGMKKNGNFSSSELECLLKISLLPKGWKGSSRTHILLRKRNSLRIMQFSENITKIQAESGESKIFCRKTFPINVNISPASVVGSFSHVKQYLFQKWAAPPLRVIHFSLIPPFPLPNLESCMLHL